MNQRIDKLEAFLKETPDDPFLNHAIALEYIKEGLDEQAARYFTKNITQKPDYVATYYHLGKLLERSGETANAIATYQAGMEVAKKEGDMHSYNELQAAYEDLAW